MKEIRMWSFMMVHLMGSVKFHESQRIKAGPQTDG
jgi:hypothetical protein